MRDLLTFLLKILWFLILFYGGSLRRGLLDSLMRSDGLSNPKLAGSDRQSEQIQPLNCDLEISDQ